MKNKDIYSLLLSLLGIHYFFSYLILKNSLQHFGLDSLSIISMEDIMFSNGSITFDLMKIISVGFVIIFLGLIIEKYRPLSGFILDPRISKKQTQKTSPKEARFLFWIISYKCFAILFISTVGSAFGILLGYLIFTIEWSIFLRLFSMVIFCCLIFPISYIAFKRSRIIIMYGYLISLVLFGHNIISYVYDNKSVNELLKDYPNNATIIYDNEEIKFSSKEYIIYSGSKFLIVHQDSTSKTNKIYQMNRVGFMSISKTTENFSKLSF